MILKFCSSGEPIVTQTAFAIREAVFLFQVKTGY
jgi:hypothetical protein